LAKDLLVLDKKHTTAMKKIIGKYGWPKKSIAGKRGCYASWLLIQHSTHDLNFQKKCLKLMKELDNKEVDPQNIAFLTDRILILENKKQKYGTQFKGNIKGTYSPFPIKDKINLDNLRKQMGLEPMEIYIKKIRGFQKNPLKIGGSDEKPKHPDRPRQSLAPQSRKQM